MKSLKATQETSFGPFGLGSALPVARIEPTYPSFSEMSFIVVIMETSKHLSLYFNGILLIL